MTLPVAILAGGLAMRLRPVTEKMPKALIEINGEPFAYHQLRLLRRNGVERAVFCLGHLGNLVAEAVGDGSRFGMQVEYSYDGPVLLGTGGAIGCALPMLGRAFFVLYGDSYLDCDYAAIERAYLNSGRPALMTVYRNNGQWDTSNVELKAGEIVAYSKNQPNPRMLHIDYGLGVFSDEAFKEVKAPADLAEIYQQLLKAKKLAAFEVNQRFYEVGSFAGIEELKEMLTRRGENAES